jgi:hypothetical protein
MSPAAFARVSPLEQQTWMLSVFRERVVWQRTHVVATRRFEFVAADWGPPPARPAGRRASR